MSQPPVVAPMKPPLAALRVVPVTRAPEHAERLALMLLAIAPAFPRATALRLWEEARGLAHEVTLSRAYQGSSP